MNSEIREEIIFIDQKSTIISVELRIFNPEKKPSTFLRKY